jgi:hypothetical protein
VDLLCLTYIGGYRKKIEYSIVLESDSTSIAIMGNTKSVCNLTEKIAHLLERLYEQVISFQTSRFILSLRKK